MNTTPPPPIRKFNPGTHQSDREVIRQFVVRHRELDTVLEILHRNIDSPSCQHALLVAPRGRGKTMLLARVEAELRTDDALSSCLFPVRFMEESLEIFDLADFWSEALFHLAREIEATGAYPNLARELRATHTALTGRWGESNVADYLQLAVLDTADRLGRRLVLMVENLQALCDEQVDEDFGWELRKTLQSEPRIMLLGSATSRFEALDDADQAFFELFHTVSLKPLSTRECQALWQLATSHEVNESRIRPVQILTGGSPRLLIMVAEFAEHGSLYRLMDELVRLIDDHTEYFRGHLEAITAKKERRVYVAVIDLWQPSTTREIAARARMDIRVVSSLLGRLITRGVIIIAEGTGKKKRYVAAERLYSLYYKLRRERDEAAVVRNLLHFMAVFYDKTELAGMSVKLMSEAAQSPAIREGMKRAITEIPEIGNAFPDLFQPDTTRSPPDDGPHPSQSAEEAARKLIEQGVAQGLRGDHDAAMATLAEVVERFADSDVPGVQEWVAKALFNRGMAHGQRGDHEAAMAIFAKVVERYGDSEVPGVQETVAKALFNHGVAHGQRGDHEAAMAIFAKVVERYGDSEVPGVQEMVASALFSRGVAQSQRGDHDAAMATYDRVVERYGDSEVPGVQETVASALFNQGLVQGERRDHEAAMASFAKVVERYGDSEVPGVQETVAKALLNHGVAQSQRGDHDAAMATFAKVAERFEDSEVPGVQETVANALFNHGVAHGQRGNHEAAMAIFAKVVERYGDSEVPGVQEWVVKALFNHGVAHGQRGDIEAAMAIFAKVVERYGDSEVPGVQETVASALFCRGVAQSLRGDYEAAIATYDRVVECYGDSEVPGVQETVASALFCRGVAQSLRGDYEAAIAIYDRVVECYGDSEVPGVQETVASALFNQGLVQGERRDHEAAMASFAKIVERYGDSDVSGVQKWVTEALSNQGNLHLEGGRTEEALRLCDQLERRLAVVGDEELRLGWLTGWLRTRALVARKEHRAAMEAFRYVYDIFRPDDRMMMFDMLQRVPELIASGASARDVADVLASDGSKSDWLFPLLVALRQRAGETVRAPVEVMEIAEDIHKLLR